MLSLDVNMQFNFIPKRWLIPLALFLFVAIVMALPFPVIYRWIYEGEALVVKSFSVVETQHVNSAEVKEYLKDYLGKPFYGVDLNEMARRLERHPWISSVALRRVPPHEILIRPTERKPIAVVSLGPLLLVDETGKPFQVISASNTPSLPLIKLKQKNLNQLRLASDAIKIYNSTQQSAGKISVVHFDESKSVQAVFASGLHVDLGKDKFTEKWAKLETIMNTPRESAGHFTYIYLGDYPNSHQVAVKFELDNDARGYVNGSTEKR